MKIRKDFVTNSSSSSYICDACGHVEAGWDMCLSEAEMCECENGHTICLDEMKELDFDMKKSYLVRVAKENIKYYEKCVQEDPDKTYYHDRLAKEKEDLAKLESLTEEAYKDDYDLEEFFDDLVSDSELEYNYPAESCPICSRSIVMEHELIDYACKQLNITKAELTDAARAYLIAEDEKKKNK